MSRTLVHYYFTTRQELLRAAFAYAERSPRRRSRGRARVARDRRRAGGARARAHDRARARGDARPLERGLVEPSLRRGATTARAGALSRMGRIGSFVCSTKVARTAPSRAVGRSRPVPGGGWLQLRTAWTRSCTSACSIVTPRGMLLASCIRGSWSRDASLSVRGAHRASASRSTTSRRWTTSRSRSAAASSSRCSARPAVERRRALRMIAGFERPDAGRIVIGDADVTEMPPHLRPVNTVFQSYALFPHLSVEQNVGFGLRFTDVSKDERRGRVAEALELVRLGDAGSASAAPALRRAAAACRSRARARALAVGAPARRATRRARREAAPRAPDRAEEHPARDRHHVPLRHA